MKITYVESRQVTIELPDEDRATGVGRAAKTRPHSEQRGKWFRRMATIVEVGVLITGSCHLYLELARTDGNRHTWRTTPML